ncbi:unnamed protein product [Rangifer tarandus platyrhynchus]|uniref:Uncharacterized protein n=2 Tax=Rangifer tarandus platyrhynchus TaxID=3082113 RepID=A0ABN8Z3C1_RANTA|nr:unnamed protein product [Rangifer tarandus platyrhynchus]
MGFPRQESWSGLPFASPGDLPDPGIEPISPAWWAVSLPLSHLGSLTMLSCFNCMVKSYSVIFSKDGRRYYETHFFNKCSLLESILIKQSSLGLLDYNLISCQFFFFFFNLVHFNLSLQEYEQLK